MPLTKVTPNNLHTTVQTMVTTMVNENAVDSADVVTLVNANAIDSADATLIINSNIAAKSTSDLSEGSNLYYTNARADARVNLQTGANLVLSNKSTSDLSEGSNLYYTNARADARIAAATTSDLSEGTNKYYTTSRGDSDTGVYIAGNRTYGNITTTGYIAGPATMTIDPAAVGDNTGTLVVAGNLQVDGTTTTINSTTVTVDDKTLILGDGSTTDSQANGTAVVFGGQSNAASIFYTSATDTIGFGNIAGISVPGTVTATGGAANNDNSAVVISANSTQHAKIKIDTSSTGNHRSTLALESGSYEVNIATSGLDEMRFSTSNTSDALFIGSDGDVGIGCIPDQKLHVKGTIETQATNSTNGWQLYTYTDNSFRVNFNGAGADEFQINSDGNAIFLKNLSIGDSTLSTYHTDYPAVELGASGSVQGYTGNNGAWLQSNLFMNTNGHWTSKSDDFSAMLELYDGNFNFYNTASGTGTRTLLTPMTIRQSGNVGIGATSPTYKLQVEGTGDTVQYIANANPSGANGRTLLIRDNYASSSQDSKISFAATSSPGQDVYLGKRTTSNAGYFHLTSSAGAEHLTVNMSSGSVGIGTTSPGQKLTIEGTADNINSEVRITATGVASGYLGADSNGFNIGTDTAGLYFKTGVTGGQSVGATGSARMVINSSGNVGIGTTSPSAKLTITDEDAGQPMLQVRNYSTAATGGFGNAHSVELRSATSTTTHGALIHHNENNIGRRTLDVSDANGIFASFVQGKVGIGTTSPGAKLQVNGNVKLGSAAHSSWTDSVDDIGGLDVFVGSGSHAFTVWDDNSQSTARFIVERAGNVGIGTTVPSQKLEVAGNIEADGYFGDGGATSNITFSQATSTSNPSVALWGRDHSSYPGQVHIVGRNSNANTSSGDIRFWNYNGSTWYNMFRFAYDTDNSDTRTTLQTITDTNTAIVSTQSIYNIIDSNNNQTDRSFFVSCNSDRPGNATTIIKAGEDRNIVFGQNDAAGMYNGTGSNGFGVQQAGLGGQYVVVQNTTDSNLYLSKHSSYSDSRCIQFSIGGTTKGSVTVASSGTTYNTTSDLRLKTDIKPIDDATDKLLSMNPVRHKWKANPEDDAVHGFIAQEMKEVVPEAVYGDPESDEMMSMDYGRITPVVVAALQDALKEINDLKRRIKELEDK